MKKFNTKKEVFSYITNIFSKCQVILIRGSTAFGRVKNFSDFDVEAYGNFIQKPIYELVFLKDKITLITIYFYKFKKGKTTIPKEKNVKILKGIHNENLRPDFSKDKYSQEEKIKRECQLLIDFMFKYLRSKDEKSLNSVQKRI